MTPPIDDPEVLRRILANTDALLLDFDGPICSVFSGFPAPVVADQLRNILAEGGHIDLPDDVQAATDPFDVLRYAATLGEEEARYVEAAFTAHEVEAIQTAQPTPGAHDLIHAWKATGRALAIVSNNSQVAIETYTQIHSIEYVDFVAARTGADLALLKPRPQLLELAVVNLTVAPGRALFLGDSVTDVVAANSAGVRSISFANRVEKIARFTRIRTDAITTSMSLLSSL